MYNTYRTITGLSEPVLSLLLKHRLKAGKESPTRHTEKLGIPSLKRPNGDLIWIHGASIGESQSALILLNRLSEIYPNLKFLMTTGTLTSAKLMEDNLPSNAFHQFYPLDHPQYAQKFLNHWTPGMVIWMESELWPNMLHSIKAANTPAILINARMSNKSYKTWKVFPSLAKKMLNCFNTILCQTEKDCNNFTNLGAQKAITIGNIKYAASPLKCNKDELKRLIHATHDRPLWLYASTHADEESIAADIHTRLKKQFPELLTIIVPRHPDRRDKIIETLARHKDLNIELRSTQIKKTPGKNTDIYIADTLGELGLFYRLCPISCIGRSFSTDGGGGHNPIEAAQLGSVVLHGPKIQNLQDIYNDMDSQNISIQADTPNALANTLTDFIGNRIKLEQHQKQSVMYSRNKTSIINVVLEQITPIIEQQGIGRKSKPTQDQTNAI